jgi:arylsulfatase
MLCSVVAAFFALPVLAEDDPPKPNILVIVASDLGYADLGCFGGDIDTPTLDLLAEDGLRFSQFYTAGRGPDSRLSLLTGYYHDQIGVFPRPWVKTLPQMLAEADYRSYHSGRWSLERWFRSPLSGAGFDRSYRIADTARHLWPKEHYLDGRRLDAVDRSDDYNATTASADNLIDFLKEHQDDHNDQPFFAYLSLSAPHHPLQAMQDDIDDYAERFGDGWDARRARIFVKQKQMGLIDTDLSPLEPRIVAPGSTEEQRETLGPGEVPYALRWFELTSQEQRFQSEKMRVYAAMVDRMDREIGRVLTQLRRMRVYENTLIIFTSDNGASSEILIGEAGHDASAKPGSGDTYLCLGPGWATASNTPFRRHKYSTHEGGIAVPFIAHWRMAIEDEGEIYDEPTHVIDLAPTLLRLAGLEPESPAEDAPDLPGIDLMPAFTGDWNASERELFFHQDGNRALRQGYWKIVSSEDERAWSLHDTRTDRAEKNNVGKRYPEKLLELTLRWDRLRKDFEAQSQPTR